MCKYDVNVQGYDYLELIEEIAQAAIVPAPLSNGVDNVAPTKESNMKMVKFNYVRLIDPETGELLDESFNYTIRKIRVWNDFDDRRYPNACRLATHRDLLVVDRETDFLLMVSAKEALDNNVRYPVYS